MSQQLVLKIGLKKGQREGRESRSVFRGFMTRAGVILQGDATAELYCQRNWLRKESYRRRNTERGDGGYKPVAHEAAQTEFWI
jgi:hypothetical protein